MNGIRVGFGRACVLAAIFTINYTSAHAQASVPDSIVQITAEAQGLSLVAPEDLPPCGTFWEVLPGGVMAPLPCPLLDQNLPTYAITDNIFLVDATGGQVAVNKRQLKNRALTQSATSDAVASALENQATAIVNLINQVQTAAASQQMRTMAGAKGVPSPGDSGGDSGGGDSTNNYVSYIWDTNQLWLEITNVSNGTSFANLHNGTNQVYAIWSTTNLLTPMVGWQVENELWPVGDQTNVMPFTVENFGSPYLFLRAQDWTGVDSDGDGIPDWWAWNYFGTINVNATNQDYYGTTLLYDYQQGQDPNPIVFSIRPYQRVNTTAPVLPLNLMGGTPFYMATLVNDNNATNAVWMPYNPNLTVSLNSGDGSYNVQVGLRGHAADSSTTWNYCSLILDTVPPVVTVTNPVSATVSNTTINLQGLVNESLSSLTFDVGNANGVVTNQTGFMTGSDSGTNYFTCPIVSLTSGSNWITIHATDLAGNPTDLNLALNCAADISQSGLSVLWPTNGVAVSGSSFTLQAQVNNPTASIFATIVDASGNTNTVSGLVEGNGAVWVKNLPLAAGNNTVTVTAGLASGVTNTQTFTVVGNDIGLTIDPLTQLNQARVTVTGSVGDPVNDCVWVNGQRANVDPDTGDWEADEVPVSPTGTAALNVKVYVGDPVLIGEQTQFVPQPVAMQMMSYQLKQHLEYNDSQGNVSLDDYKVNWLAGVGGMRQDVGFSTAWPGSYNLQFNYGPTPSDFQTTWVNASVDVPEWRVQSMNGYSEWGSFQRQTANRVQLLAPGGQTAGVTNVYLVRFASVSSNLSVGDYSIDVGGNWPPEQFQIGGQPLVNTGETNTSGSFARGALWGITTVSAPAGQNVEVTPSYIVQPQGNWDYDFDMQACQLYPPMADANRDGNFSPNTASTPCRFWINDSRESGDVLSDGKDSIPGYGSPNYARSQVNGRSDLVNFFPVTLSLSNVLAWLPVTNGYEYHLSQADSAVKFVYTSLTNGNGNAFDYLTNLDSYGYGTNANEWVTNADTISVTNSQIMGTMLDTNWLAMVQTNGGNGIILLEGCAATTAPLMLEIWGKDQNGNKQLLGGSPMYLSLDGVEQMYRQIDLRGGYTGLPAEPPNNPDNLCNGKHIVFIHGFSISGDESRGENAEVFKRLYQAHSHAMFTGVDWQGDDSPWFDWTGKMAYYDNVTNAFITASNFKAAVSDLPGAQKYVMAHSLGNMVASSAIKDFGLSVNSYFALDAAVATEAYDGDNSHLDMVYPGAFNTFEGWINYDRRLWASDWHNLFPGGDGRAGLTWINRFGVIGNIYNFYSSGEEVLKDSDGTYPNPVTVKSSGGELSWVCQEMSKGDALTSIANSCSQAGWTLNVAWYIPVDPAHPITTQPRRRYQADPSNFTDYGTSYGHINTNDFPANPFFGVFKDSRVMDASAGSDEAAKFEVRAGILAGGIPALSHATGANFVAAFGGSQNKDMMNMKTGWPQDRQSIQRLKDRWLHSDFEEVAYPFVHSLFDNIVNLGGF